MKWVSNGPNIRNLIIFGNTITGGTADAVIFGNKNLNQEVRFKVFVNKAKSMMIGVTLMNYR